MSPGILPPLGYWCPVFLVLLASCALVFPAHAAQAIPVYNTDFSIDPGWATNNPATNYWDAGKGMYHYFMQTGTNAFVNYPVPYNGESFTLSFDILPERTDYQASVNFGLGDSDQILNQYLTMFTEFENGPYGRIMWIRGIDLMDQRREASSYFLSYGGPTVQFSDGTWYHVVMDYREESHSLSLAVYRRNDSRLVWGYTLDSMSDFPTMNRISMTKIAAGGNPSAIAEGYIDNVAFSITVPTGTPQPGNGQQPAPATSTPGGVPSTGGPQATEPVPLTALPALGASALAILCARAARTRQNR